MAVYQGTVGSHIHTERLKSKLRFVRIKDREQSYAGQTEFGLRQPQLAHALALPIQLGQIAFGISLDIALQLLDSLFRGGYDFAIVMGRRRLLKLVSGRESVAPDADSRCGDPEDGAEPCIQSRLAARNQSLP